MTKVLLLLATLSVVATDYASGSIQNSATATNYCSLAPLPPPTHYHPPPPSPETSTGTSIGIAQERTRSVDFAQSGVAMVDNATYKRANDVDVFKEELTAREEKHVFTSTRKTTLDNDWIGATFTFS